MGVKTLSEASSERQKWDKIFEGMVKMLKTQQQQLEALAKERKILEDRIKMQYERWVSDVHLYEDHISQMKSDLESKEMARVLEAAKADLMVGLKHREAYLCKLKLEETEDELADFEIWFHILSKNSKDISQKDPKETKNGVSGRQESGSKSVTLRALEAEVRMLKLEYKNLASEKSSQVAALMAENKFAWNQLNILESECPDKLNIQHSELEQANRKIEALITNMEELRSSNSEKDKIIERLKSEVSQKEADVNRFHEEVSKMSREVELLRKSRSASCTPVIKRCLAGGRTSVLGGKNGGIDGCNIVVNKEISSPHVPELLKDDGKEAKKVFKKKQKRIEHHKLSSPMKAASAVKSSRKSVTVKKTLPMNPVSSNKKRTDSNVALKQTKKRKAEESSDDDFENVSATRMKKGRAN